MTSNKDQIAALTQPLELPTNFELPSTKTEPDESDFAELDNMLKVVKVSDKKYKTPHQKRMKDLRERNDAELPEALQYKLIEGIKVWQQVSCLCGEQTELTFVRYMERWERVSKAGCKSVNWKTVAELDQRLTPEQITDTLISRSTPYCSKCTAVGEGLPEFGKYIKGEGE